MRCKARSETAIRHGGPAARATAPGAGDRQPDDVEVVAVDPRHERRTAALDRVAAGAALATRRSATYQSTSQSVERREGHVGRRGRRGSTVAVRVGQRNAADAPSCVRPERRRRTAAAAAASARLAADLAVEHDDRVDAEDDLALAAAAGRQRLAPRVLQRDRRRLARLAPPRRRRAAASNATPSCSRIARRCGGAARRGPALSSSGKNSATSRAADSFESEPWTMFWPTSSAKSPRIEPVAASSGLVAPITWRAATTASWPSSTKRDERART